MQPMESVNQDALMSFDELREHAQKNSGFSQLRNHLAERWREVARSTLPESVFDLYENSVNATPTPTIERYRDIICDPVLKRVACSACNALYEIRKLSEWRWNGERWEHKCRHAHPQAGHFVGTTLQERMREVIETLQRAAYEFDRESERCLAENLAALLQPFLESEPQHEHSK